MGYADLRDFLRRLEKEGELVRVQVEVEKDHEIAAICRKVNDAGGPALLFEKIRGYEVPLACNLLGTKKRFSMALDIAGEALAEEWLNRTGALHREPVLVAQGACQEKVLQGKEVNLLRSFPIPIWNELDGGPYITCPIVTSRDPETHQRNASMYRLQVHDRNKIGIFMAPYRHTEIHRAKVATQDRGLPVAIAIGTDPAVALAAVAPLPLGLDEMAVAGSLRGKPLELVKCKTVDLEVPASAEIVLEGEILFSAPQEEGLHGDFTGYYGDKAMRPVVEVKTITHRAQPIYQAIYNGRPPTEEQVLRGIPMEIEIARQFSLRGVKKVNLTVGGCSAFNCVVSINKQREGYAKMIALAILGTWEARFVKTLIVVDDDIDPHDWSQVEWALATRVQPHRDVEIIRDVFGCILDPSLPLHERQAGHSRTSKMIIDATKYDADKFEIPCLPRQDVMERVMREWQKYGIHTPRPARR